MAVKRRINNWLAIGNLKNDSRAIDEVTAIVDSSEINFLKLLVFEKPEHCFTAFQNSDGYLSIPGKICSKSRPPQNPVVKVV